jgi:hypothetical protein
LFEAAIHKRVLVQTGNQGELLACSFEESLAAAQTDFFNGPRQSDTEEGQITASFFTPLLETLELVISVWLQPCLFA